MANNKLNLLLLHFKTDFSNYSANLIILHELNSDNIDAAMLK